MASTDLAQFHLSIALFKAKSVDKMGKQTKNSEPSYYLKVRY